MIATITIVASSSPDQLLSTTTPDPGLTSLLFPGQFDEPSGDTLFEQVISSPTQKMLELVSATSEMIGEAAYRAAPDYLSFDLNAPLYRRNKLEVSKDGVNITHSKHLFNFEDVIKRQFHEH